MLAGFAAGALAGWLVGELTGGVTRQRMNHYVTGLRRPAEDLEAPATPRERVRAALDADPDLSRLALDVIPAGRNAVELHGWVPSRTLRARATRLAATAAGATRLIDSLLVRGEDDRPVEEDVSPAGAPQSA
jgi:hypothetical protein